MACAPKILMLSRKFVHVTHHEREPFRSLEGKIVMAFFFGVVFDLSILQFLSQIGSVPKSVYSEVSFSSTLRRI